MRRERLKIETKGASETATEIVEASSSESGKTSEQIADSAPPVPQPKKRIWEIDFLRGICVVLMILDHLTILIADVFAPQWYGYGFARKGVGDAFSIFCYNWWNSDVRSVIHAIVIFVFFSISGISCTLSRSNFKRGAILLGIAIVYSFGSYIAQEVIGISGVLVIFGVLDFLAVSMLLYALIELICRKNRWAICGVSAALIVVTLCLYFLYTPPADTPKIFAIVFPPEDFYGNPSLFYSHAEFSPGDLFTLIPYTAFYFAGVIIGKLVYDSRKSLLPRLDGKWNKPVCFVGRHALIVYVVHVVLLACVLSLITGLFITPGNFGF